MNVVTLRLVLLVSCAHALVHVFELSYPSVEQLIADQFGVGRQQMGLLGTCWRVPFGAFALVAGWLTDRYGAKRTLVAYLFGCSAMVIAAASTQQFAVLFVVFFAMGMFASVYHPAGLALISHAVERQYHPRALGIHGIFGSVGIAVAPFLAALVLSSGVSWRGYFLMLAVPGALLGGLFLVRLDDGHREQSGGTSRFPRRDDQQPFLAAPYCVALLIAALSGFIYAATMNFMPRYLDGAGLGRWGIPPEGMRNYLTAAVLLLGVIGQYTAGRVARPHTLEPCLAVIMFLVVPSLLAMATAVGAWRLWAAGAFAVVYFMSQPVYNSLIPRYVPARRRSLGYGVNFTVTFGIGGLGATFAGYAPSQAWNYGTLAACASVAGILALVLWKLHGQRRKDEEGHGN